MPTEKQSNAELNERRERLRARMEKKSMDEQASQSELRAEHDALVDLLIVEGLITRADYLTAVVNETKRIEEGDTPAPEQPQPQPQPEQKGGA